MKQIIWFSISIPNISTRELRPKARMARSHCGENCWSMMHA